MTDAAILQARLTEAEAALHALLTGAKAQSVTVETGRSVTYTPGNEVALRRHIADLKRQLGQSGMPRPVRPLF